MGQKQDMSLGVNVAVSGVYDGSKVTFSSVNYTQGTTNPVSTNVVDSAGNIDLRNMNRDKSIFNRDTDITFHVSGSVTDPNGNSLSAFFPQPSQAVTVDGHPPSGQFTVSGNGNDVILGDVNNDGKTYNYCLNVDVQPQGGVAPVSSPLDPSIINRGVPNQQR